MTFSLFGVGLRMSWKYLSGTKWSGKEDSVSDGVREREFLAISGCGDNEV